MQKLNILTVIKGPSTEHAKFMFQRPSILNFEHCRLEVPVFDFEELRSIFERIFSNDFGFENSVR